MPYKDPEKARAKMKVRYWSDPETSRTYNRALYAKNKRATLARNEAWRKANPAKVAAARRRYYEANKEMFLAASRKHNGIPVAPYAAPSACECCGRPPGLRRLHADHDHNTGAFRGWLCARCNPAIGALGDNIEGVGKALRYLRNVISMAAVRKLAN